LARTSPNVTDAEWAVLERLWDQGPASIRQLAAVLYPKGGASEYATVHKLLERLEAKKFVQRKRVEGVYLFEATASRDAVVGRQLEALVDKMYGGSLQPLLMNLVRVKRLTAQELRDLLALVDALDRKSKSKK
jgi:BlaI family transcriptional regulator, penicillinase repressor